MLRHACGAGADGLDGGAEDDSGQGRLIVAQAFGHAVGQGVEVGGKHVVDGGTLVEHLTHELTGGEEHLGVVERSAGVGRVDQGSIDRGDEDFQVGGSDRRRGGRG